MKLNKDKRLIAGVCAGIADKFNLDPWLVRIAFILFAHFFGFGLITYLILWLFMSQN